VVKIVKLEFGILNFYFNFEFDSDLDLELELVLMGVCKYLYINLYY